MSKFESLPEPCPDARLAPATSGAEPSALADLLARVEAATGPDRELDTDLWFELAWDGQGDERDVAPLTASLDAALALVERVLPGWMPCVRQDPRPAFEGLWHAFVARAGTGREQHASWGATPALALLSAMLRAIADRRC